MYGMTLPPALMGEEFILEVECLCGHEFQVRARSSDSPRTITQCPQCKLTGSLDKSGRRVEKREEAGDRPVAMLYHDESLRKNYDD